LSLLLDALKRAEQEKLARGDRPDLQIVGAGEAQQSARHERAESAADEAVRTRSQVVLGPLTPAARREIHLALADDPGVETFSDGEGFLKRVVIRPVRGR